MPMTLELTNEDRYLVFRAMSPALACTVCKTGPVDTTEARKLMLYGKVWDLLDLSVFEDKEHTELLALLSAAEIHTFDFKADMLRYLIDLLLNRSYVFNMFSVAVGLLDKLIKFAHDSNVKLNGEVSTTSPEKTFLFTAKDIGGIGLLLATANTCKAEFTTNDGKTLTHGSPIDNPNTLELFYAYKEIVNSFALTNALLGKENLPVFEGTKEIKLSNTTVEYLKKLLPARSTIVNFPQHRLAGILNTLEGTQDEISN